MHNSRDPFQPVLIIFALGFIACTPTQLSSQPADPFVEAIAAMKRSVAPVTCRARDARGALINDVQKIVGSAFFTSDAGTFVTAAHVIADTKLPDCNPAIYLPITEWEPKGRTIPIRFYSFSSCSIVSRELDIAQCATDIDLRNESKWNVRVAPVVFESMRQPDGTMVAMTGFPLQEQIPVSARGSIGAYWPTETQLLGEFVIDRSGWSGLSGGPVFLSNGRVIGMVTKSGIGSRAGMMMARPAWFIQQAIEQKPKE